MSRSNRSRPFHKPPICAATGKARFRDRADATLAIRSMTFAASKRVALGLEPRPVPIRSYKCESCGGHHLTRMPLSVYLELAGLVDSEAVAA